MSGAALRRPTSAILRSGQDGHVRSFARSILYSGSDTRCCGTSRSRAWGGTEVEPNVPSTEKAIASVVDLSRIVSAAAIQWRYDPLFLSERFNAQHHIETFTRIADALRGHVDRVTTSPVEVFQRRVKPDLLQYEKATGDALITSSAVVETVHRLREIATAASIPFTPCCAPDLRAAIG